MDLPLHLIEVQILPYLSLLDIFRSQRVCRRWKDRLNQDSFWRVIVKERFFLLRWAEYFDPNFIIVGIPTLFQHCARFIQRLDRYFHNYSKLWFSIILDEVWTKNIRFVIEIITSMPIQQVDQNKELDLLISSTNDEYQVESTIGTRSQLASVNSDRLILLLVVLFEKNRYPIYYLFDEEPIGIALDDSLVSIGDFFHQPRIS